MTEELDDADVARAARERRIARGLRVAARRALALARRYRDEEGPGGARERACMAQALAWRRAAREPRLAVGPGVARARIAARDAKRQAG